MQIIIISGFKSPCSRSNFKTIILQLNFPAPFTNDNSPHGNNSKNTQYCKYIQPPAPATSCVCKDEGNFKQEFRVTELFNPFIKFSRYVLLTISRIMTKLHNLKMGLGQKKESILIHNMRISLPIEYNDQEELRIYSISFVTHLIFELTFSATYLCSQSKCPHK